MAFKYVLPQSWRLFCIIRNSCLCHLLPQLLPIGMVHTVFWGINWCKHSVYYCLCKLYNLIYIYCILHSRVPKDKSNYDYNVTLFTYVPCSYATIKHLSSQIGFQIMRSICVLLFVRLIHADDIHINTRQFNCIIIVVDVVNITPPFPLPSCVRASIILLLMLCVSRETRLD